METGNWKMGLPFSDFQFLLYRMGPGTRSGKTGLPFSSFHFPASVFRFLACAKRRRLFDQMPPELLYWHKTFLKFESK
jgi:hypothetical protein